MDGPEILAASLSVPQPRGASDILWQYHSRSDLHSKVACWGVCFDLLQQSALLRNHVAQRKVVLGVNYEMSDFSTNRKKRLDLVIARPAGAVSGRPRTLGDLAGEWGMVLGSPQRARLSTLPDLPQGPVGAVLVALEAKAAMTAHIKARPRLYDELNSSHLTVHGASRQALAVGFVMVNTSPTFISPDLNKGGPVMSHVVVSRHKQPADAEGVMAKVREIPRRGSSSGSGFDGLAIVALACANDGSPARIVTAPPAPQRGDIYHYETMVTRIANEYDTTFGGI